MESCAQAFLEREDVRTLLHVVKHKKRKPYASLQSIQGRGRTLDDLEHLLHAPVPAAGRARALHVLVEVAHRHAHVLHQLGEPRVVLRMSTELPCYPSLWKHSQVPACQALSCLGGMRA